VSMSEARALGRRRLLGLLTLVGMIGAVVLLWQRPDPFSSNETVRADLADASGLAAIGADVRVAGTPVGKVTAIDRVGAVARVTMSVDASAGEIHRDARIALRPRLLFEGTAYVQLTLGSPAAPALGNAVIPRRQTSTYVPFADAISVLQPRTRGDIHQLARTAATLLSPTASAQLRDAITATPQLARDAAVVAGAARGAHASELRDAIASLSQVTSAAASRSDALAAVLRETAPTAAALGADAGWPLRQTLAQLPATDAALYVGARAASSLVERLRALVGKLQPGVQQLTPTLAVARPLLRAAVPVLDSLDPVLGDAQTALSGARSGASPALHAITALEPTLQIFQSTLLSALEQQTNLGTPAYLAFLGLFAGGGGASRPFGVDGQGHFMRFGLRFLTGVGQPLPPCALLAKVSPAVATALEAVGGCTP
jgi:phospholipid/cholesterol/gamma-HCH transport system substrate-binding protein